MAELHPDNACTTARAALGYAQAFDGKGIDWQSDEPWPHRIELAQALDWITELGAMVLNLADLLRAGAEAADVLRQEASILRDCHTIDGRWDGSEPEVEASYRRFLTLAARLTPNVRAEPPP